MPGFFKNKEGYEKNRLKPGKTFSAKNEEPFVD